MGETMRRWFKGFHRGGIVTGPRVGDDIPALLSGERLVDAFNDMANAVGWRVRADEGVVE